MDWFDKKSKEMLEDDFFIDAQFMANSRQEALDLVGDDSFYPGYDSIEDDENYDDFSDEFDSGDDD